MTEPLGLSIGTTNLVAARVGRPPVTRRSILNLFAGQAPEVGAPEEISGNQPGVVLTGFVDRVGDPVPLVAADGSAHRGEQVLAEPPSTRRVIAARASASTCSPRCALPSAAIRGTGSPTRSTKPVSTTPDAEPAGISSGAPTSGACPGERLSIERRVTGGRPTRAATRLVVPMDNPSGSVMAACLLSGPVTTLAARPPPVRDVPLVWRIPYSATP